MALFDRRPRLDWLLGACLLAGVVFAALAVRRWGAWSYGSDTGTFVQLILDTWGGFRNGVEAGSHLRFHWSPVLALLWPLLAVFRHPLTLQFVQIAATIAVAPLLRALVTPYTTPRFATALGALALVYPPLAAIAFNEFHELCLWPPVCIGLLLAADRGAWRWFAVLVVLGVTIREDVCLLVAILGGWFVLIAATSKPGAGILAWAPRGRTALARAGVAACAAGSLTAAVYFAAIVPRLGGWAPSHFYDYPFAHGPLALVAAVVTQPAAVWSAIANTGRLTYLLEVFVPLALFPLATRWGLLLLPGLAICLLSHEDITWRMGDHYASLWSPFALVATSVVALRVRARLAMLPIVLSALTLIVANPMHPGHFLRPTYHAFADAVQAFDCVPLAASVATHDEWFTRESARRPRATVAASSGTEYVVVADDYPNALWQNVLRPAFARERAQGAYREVCRYGQVVAARRTP